MWSVADNSLFIDLLYYFFFFLKDFDSWFNSNNLDNEALVKKLHEVKY